MSEIQAHETTAARGDGATPIDTVRAFFMALGELDIDRALSYVAPDIVYQNVPLPPTRGLAAFERQLRALSRFATGFQAEIHHIAANGPIVLTERTDVLEAGAWRAPFWVCGTVEVRDGRIVLWRDYFDWLTFIAACVGGIPRAVRSMLAGRRAG